MPYIKKEDKVDVLEIAALALKGNKDGLLFVSAGEFNYIVTTLCNIYLKTHSESYYTLNEIMGILECAKQEFYRRAVVPYENDKIKENGDVY